jgi:succinate dehydrogenase / fumarate reductase cytochrome b subunit
MSSIAVDARPGRSFRFYETTLGKKAVMAVTGAILFAFLVGHMIGNLQVFAGPDKINDYAVQLRKLGPALWVVRLVLLASVVLHIWASIQLTLLQRRARPEKYVKKRNLDSSYASRTMIWSGPIIAAFALYHLAHFTWVVFPGYEHLKPYENIVRGFQNPAISAFYIAAIIMLMLHLRHGVWSMFQTMGFAHPRYTPKLKLFASVFALLLGIGFIIVPVAVLLGFIGLEARV